MLVFPSHAQDKRIVWGNAIDVESLIGAYSQDSIRVGENKALDWKLPFANWEQVPFEGYEHNIRNSKDYVFWKPALKLWPVIRGAFVRHHWSFTYIHYLRTNDY